MELVLMPKGGEPHPDPPGTEGWREEKDECVHDWQPVGSTNAAGRASRCEKCWDRTD